MAKTKTITSSWNEFNTFSKLIYPELQNKLKYPERSSKFFDEQTWVRKRGEKNGPYDGAFKNETGVILLIEAKKEDHTLLKKDEEQLFDYCLGGFPVPPPYALLSNGVVYKWYKRLKNRDGEFSYAPCDPITWKKALEEKGSGNLTEQLTLKQTIRLLKSVRETIFDDLAEQFFPSGFTFKSANLGSHKKGFDKILYTRKSFVDPTLEDANEDVVIKSILSSIALSITLKVLFVKIITDRKNDPFPEKFKKEISKLAKNFPGILKAEPYDALEISDSCEEFVVGAMSSASITQALVFEGRSNPIGDIWDGLVESEELDLQVKSLGNVYTPPEIVNAMVDKAERALKNWSDKKILEPSCGSGHFVREIYSRMRESYLGKKSGNADKVILAHKNTLSNIFAQDIDPFAVQTTQLGMFLELYRTPGLWNAIAPTGFFDFGNVVKTGDFLDDGLFSRLGEMKVDLIIGNPPYGVKITKELVKHFNLDSTDSYGAFISRSLDILSESGELLFIVSNTFMTTKSHQALREQIYKKSKIDSVFNLHRNAFAGRDVFCCILHLLRKKDENANNYFYKYCDSWPIHPKTPEYKLALDAWASNKSVTIDSSKYAEYQTNAEFCMLRKHSPHAKDLESFFDSNTFIGQRKLLKTQPIAYPIFGGLTSLFLLCSDQESKGLIEEKCFEFPTLGKIDGLNVSLNETSIPLVKLWQVSRVFQGLCTSDDEYFIRKTKGIIPNARRRYIQDVDSMQTISGDDLKKLSQDDKENGIRVVDKKKTKYFVPFDKGGEQDTEAGELRAYWSNEDYWIDWSKEAVSLLKERNAWPQGTSKKPRLQNTRFYFTQGIRFAPAGLYAPMFELSFGGVPGHKGSIILPANEELTYYLLPILCSSAVRYLTKNFLQHTVMTEIDVVKQIPIPVPTKQEYELLSNECKKIIALKRERKDSKAIEQKLDQLVFKMYGFNKSDQDEFQTWFKRRYPHFGKSKDA